MIADQNFNDTCFAIIYPTASATVYGRRPKFFMAEHSATAEGENRAYGPTLHILKIKVGPRHYLLKNKELALLHISVGP